MSNLKQQLGRARAQYGNVRYDGDLARDIGLTQPRLRWWIPGSALLAAAAVLAMVFLLRDAERAATPETSLTIAKVLPVPSAVAPPTVAANQNDAEEEEPDADLMAQGEEDESEIYVAPTTLSIPFGDIPGMHSVSAGITGLGGFPALEWNTNQESQTSTTQESAS
jgi:hypothetical protein